MAGLAPCSACPHVLPPAQPSPPPSRTGPADILLGYHSEEGWTATLRLFSGHYGLEAEVGGRLGAGLLAPHPPCHLLPASFLSLLPLSPGATAPSPAVVMLCSLPLSEPRTQPAPLTLARPLSPLSPARHPACPTALIAHLLAYPTHPQAGRGP